MGFLLGLVLPMFLLIPVGFALQKVQDKVRKKAASLEKNEPVHGTIYFSSNDKGATTKSFSFEARPSGAFRSKLS